MPHLDGSLDGTPGPRVVVDILGDVDAETPAAGLAEQVEDRGVDSGTPGWSHGVGVLCRVGAAEPPWIEGAGVEDHRHGAERDHDDHQGPRGEATWTPLEPGHGEGREVDGSQPEERQLRVRDPDAVTEEGVREHRGGRRAGHGEGCAPWQPPEADEHQERREHEERRQAEGACHVLVQQLHLY